MAENQGFTSKDAALIVTAKPSGTTATTAASNAIDVGAISALAVHTEPFELEVDIPAFTATELPSDATLTISLQSCDEPTFTSPTTEWSQSIGDGTAFAGAVVRYRPALRANQYWRVAILTALANSGAVADSAQAKEVALSYVC